MRLLIACGAPQCAEGGVAGVVHNLSNELRGRGHRVETLFSENLMPECRLPHRFQDLDFSWTVARYIASHKAEYDVVNIHAPYGFIYGVRRRWGPLASAPPYVMTMHGLEERRIYAMRREAAKGRAWYFRVHNRLWHRIYHMPTYRYSIVTADQSVVLNREAASCLQLKYGRDAGRVWYVPNGVDKQFFVPRDYDAGVPSKLLFVGGWLDHKGVYYLRDGFTALAREFPDIQLTIAGCGVDARFVHDFFPTEVRERLNIIPFVPRSEIAALYARHDLFVFPSLVEGMPLVLLEAMAAGMPVVSTDVCGMADLLENGQNGLLVKPADTEGFITAIRRFLLSQELRERLGRAALETARKYTWGSVADQFEHVLKLAIRGHAEVASP